MLAALPKTVDEVMSWTWPQIAPYYDEIAARPLSDDNVDQWLADWSKLANLLDETRTRMEVGMTRNTEDTALEARFNTFLSDVFPEIQKAEQRLKEKLVPSE